MTDQPTIYELMRQVREHPDFAFGTMFTAGDFPGGVLPADFNGSVIEDVLAERGNLYIWENYPDDEEDE